MVAIVLQVGVPSIPHKLVGWQVDRERSTPGPKPF